MSDLAEVSPYVNIFFQDKNIQLKQAVTQGDYKLVEKFLSVDKLDVNFTSNGQETYLHIAIARNDLSMVKLLLKFKPNLNPVLTASNVYSPLWLAMLCSYDDIFELLVRSGANVNETLNSQCTCGEFLNYGGKTLLLHMAVIRKHESKVKLLLDYGAEINKVDREKETALHLALSHEYITIARLLIHRGADLEATSEEGLTPFHMALLTGNSKVIQLMIDVGSNVKAIDSSGKTALHFIAESRLENLPVAEKLIGMGISVNHTENSCGLIPMHVALLMGKNELVKFFLEQGSNVNARISGGINSLCLAVIRCKPDILKYLISKGADVNERTDAGETTLHRAARFESVDKISLLLEQGADINIKDNNERTALAWMRNKNSEAAKTIAKHLAEMKASGAFIENCLLQIIWNYETLRIHFEHCYKQNVFMMNAHFYNNYTLRNLLDESDEKLAVLARNRSFVEAFKSIDVYRTLPNYGKQIISKFEKAEKAKNVLFAMEKYVNSSFDYSLPPPVVREIIKHLEQQDLPNLAVYMVQEELGIGPGRNAQ